MGAATCKKRSAFVDKVDHPLVPAIKLAAAIELKDDALLQACIAETKKRGDKADLAELGALLLWRVRDAAQASEVLGAGGRRGTRGAAAGAGARRKLGAAGQDRRAGGDGGGGSRRARRGGGDGAGSPGRRERGAGDRGARVRRGQGGGLATRCPISSSGCSRSTTRTRPTSIAPSCSRSTTAARGAERAATQFLLAGALERARRRGRSGRAGDAS